MKLSIVIPCYNEAANIPLILEEYAKIIKRNDIEVVLVNNNSKDDTAEVLARLSPQYPFLKTVFEGMAGYGSAILAGLRQASGEFIGWTHGDMQTPPQNVIRALEIIETKKSPEQTYVKGRRYGRPLFDRFFTFGMSMFESLYLGAWLYDINAQPNIFHKSFFATWKNPPTDFSLDLFALFKAKKSGLNIIRFKVPFLARIHGESTWNTGMAARWKFIKRTFAFSFKMKKEKRD